MMNEVITVTVKNKSYKVKAIIFMSLICMENYLFSPTMKKKTTKVTRVFKFVGAFMKALEKK